jgi:hypothetical protein
MESDHWDSMRAPWWNYLDMAVMVGDFTKCLSKSLTVSHELL